MSDSYDDKNWLINPSQQDDDGGYSGSETESRDLGEPIMGRLVEWLESGKSISRNDLAEVLKSTQHNDIPWIVRVAIINELDSKIKTGRARRHAFKNNSSSLFKRALIRLEYREKKKNDIKEIRAMEEVAEENRCSYETIRSIVKSKD